MKQVNLRRIFTLLVLFAVALFFTNCTLDFEFSGHGYLKVENNMKAIDKEGNVTDKFDKNFAIRAIVAYQDGEEVYRMDGVYKDESETIGQCNIEAGKYCTYEWDAGTYDICLYAYDKSYGYWYGCLKEGVSVYLGSTETITLNNGGITLLVPSKVSSTYNNLPEVMKTFDFVTLN